MSADEFWAYCPECETIIEAPTKARFQRMLENHIKSKHPDEAGKYGL